jgi:sulfite oxidase
MLKEVDGIDWGDAAIMNCKWRGPRLRDVLHRAGVDQCKGRPGLHVAFSSFQVQCEEDEWFGGSVELERGLDEEADVILALEVGCTHASTGIPFYTLYDLMADRQPDERCSP